MLDDTSYNRFNSVRDFSARFNKFTFELSIADNTPVTTAVGNVANSISGNRTHSPIFVYFFNPIRLFINGFVDVFRNLISIPAVCVSYESGIEIRNWLKSQSNLLALIEMRNVSQPIKARNVVATLKGEHKKLKHEKSPIDRSSDGAIKRQKALRCAACARGEITLLDQESSWCLPKALEPWQPLPPSRQPGLLAPGDERLVYRRHGPRSSTPWSMS